MKKTVRSFVFLMILLLCLAVFAVACDKEAPEEQAPDTPPADTPSNENPSTEDSTPSAPEQPAEKPLPEVLTAPLTETFADVNRFLINNVNRALKESGIQAIYAKEFFRTQHADTYIGSLGVSELYLETDAQGEQRIVRLVFDLDGLAAASVHATTDAPDWLQPRLISPAMIANIREDARLTVLQLLCNGYNDSPRSHLFNLWHASKENSHYLLFGDYYRLPEGYGATHLVITFTENMISGVSLRQPSQDFTLPDDFYPTPDMLHDNTEAHRYLCAALYDAGFDITDGAAMRALLRKHWADDLLQQTEDYDTYRLPGTPEKAVRIYSATSSGLSALYTLPLNQIDIVPIRYLTPADILSADGDLSEALVASASLGGNGSPISRMGLIEHWGDYYIGSDNLTDYFYETIPTERQIAANEMINVLVVRCYSVNGRITVATKEQHGADRAQFGSSGLEIPSLEALLMNNVSPSRYFHLLCDVHGITMLELREVLHEEWAPSFHRTVQATVHDSRYSADADNCPVFADIYSLHPTQGESIDEIKESELVWIEYFEDGTLRNIGKGNYVPRDWYIVE